ncbi:uncharacterized protein MELLADRAFT_61843 [Melampsora larici-populina 98AG31]|uniref:Uncharacterized protein n=1 Tax=Melampsora larici-populina (strain 98AG31 / pathotype 3-4-7) TaxID=747676 RepID=F4RG30_MELLP|nr:uncharacterized protein MELLADRAFT_61843 [Melampsora larici-populina 98AG31]EGG08614.1 hypothetical protein MELLADRAFT_61843 [Melampsora larici-populina 98AG31]
MLVFVNIDHSRQRVLTEFSQTELAIHNSTPRLKLFETDVIIDSGALEGIKVFIATERNGTSMKLNHAFRIDGEVAAGGSNSVSTIFEDSITTISIDHAEVRLNCMLNRVTTHGIGRIEEWSRRVLTPSSRSVEYIKVLHRCTAFMRHDFHVIYLLKPHITDYLSIDALNVGNVISLCGVVVAHQQATNTWEIEVSEVQMIQVQPAVRESRQQRDYRNTPSIESKFTLSQYKALMRVAHNNSELANIIRIKIFIRKSHRPSHVSPTVTPITTMTNSVL